MQMIKNKRLKALNTFGVAANAAYYTEVHHRDDIEALLAWKARHDAPNLILGGGSNLLFTEDYAGLVSKMSLQGKEIIDKDDAVTYVKAAGGENWHAFVRWTIDQGLSGLENLSLIPGHVGAAPIQNIGAYGVELAEHFYCLEAMDLDSGDIKTFSKEDCQFGYRESYFKSHALDQLLILSVTFALPHQVEWKTDYAGLKERVSGKALNAALISDAIMQLRQSKLPDPKDIGNAGSFFKNPVLETTTWDALKSTYDQLPGYPQSNGMTKTSAAWLIDQCHWKGYRKGDVGVSRKHALVLVNYGTATGGELWQLAQAIVASVEDKFGITLEAEPRVL